MFELSSEKKYSWYPIEARSVCRLVSAPEKTFCADT